jgi:hypothetical protein
VRNVRTVTVLLCAVLAGALLAGGCSTETTAPGTTVAVASVAEDARTAGSTGNTGPVRYPALQYAIRDTGPAGGVIFFASLKPFPCGENLENLCNYLEASPQSAEVRRPWGSAEGMVTGADGSDFGTGHANTVKIVRQGNDDPATSAAAYADAYVFGGKDDWYLPSRDECHELVIAREVLGGFQSDTYWTSTERDAAKAWYQSFKTSFQFNESKFGDYLVRPIRAF